MQLFIGGVWYCNEGLYHLECSIFISLILFNLCLYDFLWEYLTLCENLHILINCDIYVSFHN